MRVTLENIKSQISYNADCGSFIWLKSGLPAGCTFPSGYHYIRIDGRMVGAHRVAIFFASGILPDLVDHINGDPSDNRLKNLRLCTPSENRANSRVRADSASGQKCVAFRKDRNKWRATIGPRGAVKTLGHFNTCSEAVAAVRSAAKEIYGDFARTD